jgi:DNA-binding NarL/FixJ family response regulator
VIRFNVTPKLIIFWVPTCAYARKNYKNQICPFLHIFVKNFPQLQQPINILLADNRFLIRNAFSTLINSVPDLALDSLIINSIQELQNIPDNHKYDIIIIDKNSGNFFDDSSIPDTSEVFKNFKVLVISDFDKEYIYKVHKINISGFITFDATKNEIIDAIRKTAAGIKYFSPKIVEALIAMTYGAHRPLIAENNNSKTNSVQATLSEREKEILKLVVMGKSAQEMADSLFLSIHTIYTHRKNILKKLSCKNATELFSYAMKNGLIDNNV